MNTKEKIAELERQIKELLSSTESPVLVKVSGKEQRILSRKPLGGRKRGYVKIGKKFVGCAIQKIPVISVEDK